jgi:hypothetical protein
MARLIREENVFQGTANKNTVVLFSLYTWRDQCKRSTDRPWKGKGADLCAPRAQSEKFISGTVWRGNTLTSRVFRLCRVTVQVSSRVETSVTTQAWTDP